MTTLLRLLLVLVLAMRCAPVLADSASLFAQAQSSDPTRYTDAISKGASFAYTSDNRSFYGWWQPANWTPSAGVIVPLHGTGGYATTGLSLWLPYAEARGHAILSLSWWFGSGDSTTDYYTPSEMYPLLSGVLQAKGVRSGQALFTAFSRGSANSYAVAALDYASTGQRHFGLVHSNAGGAAVDYPPNKEIIKGTYGALPFSGIPWAMYCGEKDPNPDRDGCPAMTAAKNWVTQYGANVLLFVADPNGDHGGFMLNSSNVNQLLDQYKSLLSTSGVSGAPVCTLSASPASITIGASATLTATCNPAASSYVWTGGTCAGTSASSCTVSPTTTTTYTVTGVNTGGTSQAASATVTVAASATSYTVPGTLGNDVFVLTAGNFYYGGGGNDTYIISPNTLGSSVTAKIVDTEGDNLIQLVDGMTVTASAFYSDAAQLTLSNGAKVQILGASKFKFQLGANALAGDTAAVLAYTDFVTSLGASLTSGTLPVSGTAGYVVPTGFTQATAPVASVAGNASTVAGTLGDDVLVPAGGNNYLGGGGSDTYIISPYTLSGAVTARIIDTEGTNVIQLVGGLTIASSSFFSNAVQFVLSNSATVQILGASSFGYQLGANAPAGQTVSSQSYAQFAATLGASVPTGTSAVSGSTNFVVQGSTTAGDIRMMFTITGRTKALGDPKCAYPNTTYPNQGYYCSLVETIRSAISSDGINFYLEESEWFTHGDMADPAWGVGSDGVWRLVAGTTSVQGVRDGWLRYTESETCPNFPGSGSKGTPGDLYFREATANGGVLSGGAPSIADADGEARAYYGMTDGIGMATITGGQLQPSAKNPVLRPSDVGYSGLVVISDPAVVQRSDGSYVMYFKGLGLPDSDPDPRDHMLFRATSADGISNWVTESKPLVMGASVPGVTRDRAGKVWIYFLYFGADWSPTPTDPKHIERPYVIWENSDGSVSSPQPVVFFPAQHEVDPQYPLSFYNDPDPVRNPASGEKGYCPAKTVVTRP